MIFHELVFFSALMHLIEALMGEGVVVSRRGNAVNAENAPHSDKP